MYAATNSMSRVVSGRVDIGICTQGRTYSRPGCQGTSRIQWSNLPKAGTNDAVIAMSYTWVSLRTDFPANTPTAFRHMAEKLGRKATNQRQGQTNSEVYRSTEVFSH